VDAKLLEELMGILEPGEEILPSDTIANEAGVEEPEELWVPTKQQVTLALACVLLLGALGKITLRHGWRLAPSNRLAIRWGYISAASLLYDLGLERRFGETRVEFAERVPQKALVPLSHLVVSSAYSPTHPGHGNNQVRDAVKRMQHWHRSLPLHTRIMGAMNPASLIRTVSGLLSGGGW
jgi:hypothetical protein